MKNTLFELDGNTKTLMSAKKLADNVIETLKSQKNIVDAFWYNNANSNGEWTGIVVEKADSELYNLLWFFSTCDGVEVDDVPFVSVRNYAGTEENKKNVYELAKITKPEKKH
ncbi:MAG: hypothetical protein LBS50_01080 [Prevotellaceae bacterium]|jgi:hypothetical protein|nr:hypothetical protein [Prevotellaceae bacterium]